MHRFLKRLWRDISAVDIEFGDFDFEEDQLNADQKALRRKTHETIAKVTDDVERRLTFNTAIASMMELFNEIGKFKDSSNAGKAVVHEACSALVRMLSPFTPHITHELWAQLGYQTALVHEAWPEVDEDALVKDSITLVLQVNGKRRANIDVPASASKEECEAAAMADANVQKHIGDATVRKVIVVPGKLVNIVAN